MIFKFARVIFKYAESWATSNLFSLNHTHWSSFLCRSIPWPPAHGGHGDLLQVLQNCFVSFQLLDAPLPSMKALLTRSYTSTMKWIVYALSSKRIRDSRPKLRRQSTCYGIISHGASSTVAISSRHIGVVLYIRRAVPVLRHGVQRKSP